MKIEKLNDNQIRCTLTKEDFESRQLDLNELAYGSDKAKTLFREMMSKAYQEFGFNVENIPLMVEAIPMAGEGITLIITKVSDPEELDTRFSRFSSKDKEEKSNPLGDILDILQKHQPKETTPLSIPKQATEEGKESTNTSPSKQLFLYEFENMEFLTRASKLILPLFEGDSQLFFDEESQRFLLLMSVEQEQSSQFHKISNLLSEYCQLSSTPKEMAFIYEHSKKLIEHNAIKQLSDLS